MTTRLLLSTALALFLANLPVSASGLLPGHNLTTKQAAAQAETVFPGKLVSVDPVNAKSAPGQYICKVIYLSRQPNGINVPIARQDGAIRGPLIPWDQGVPVKITVAPGETSPATGESYVFYVKRNTQRDGPDYIALKISSTTDQGFPARI